MKYIKRQNEICKCGNKIIWARGKCQRCYNNDYYHNKRKK